MNCQWLEAEIVEKIQWKSYCKGCQEHTEGNTDQKMVSFRPFPVRVANRIILLQWLYMLM